MTEAAEITTFLSPLINSDVPGVSDFIKTEWEILFKTGGQNFIWVLAKISPQYSVRLCLY